MILLNQKGYFDFTYEFDFFNYAGIDRPVKLVTYPKLVRVDDIVVKTDLTQDLTMGTVQVEVDYTVGPLGTVGSLITKCLISF